MIPFLVEKFGFPLHEKVKGHKTFAYLAELEKSQWYPLDEIKQLQLTKLKALVAHAYNNVPYYRQLFDRISLRPEDLKSCKDIENIPLLTKELIRNNLEELKTRTKEKLIRFNTGGSTGDPLIFFVDTRRVSYDVASRIRSRKWWGIGIGDKEVVFWGSPVELGRQDMVREIRDKLFNTRLLSAFNMSGQTMHEYARFIERYRPAHIFGYPSSIALFCKFVEAEGIDLARVGVKVVFVTAETLYPYQKEIIENTFDCPVANGYGGRDGGFIAHECPEGGMHINAENIYLEFLNNGRPAAEGESGEIVVTHLDCYGMPFIRYRIGDVGGPSQTRCPCRRGLPLMRIIEGRATDFIITPAGKVMHGLSLIYVLRDMEGIDQFKIIQKATDALLIKLVRNSKFKPTDPEWIRSQIQERMGSEVCVTFEIVDKIDPDASGKFRYVVSEIAGQSFDEIIGMTKARPN